MRLRPFFSFFGSKWRTAPKYPHPTHRAVIEPFAGSAGYAVYHHTHDVHLYDLDEKICGVWDYLIHASAADIRAIPAPVDHVNDLPSALSQEVGWLVGFWLNKASSQPHKSMSAWGKQYPTQFWGEKIRERLAMQVEYIRHWSITQASYGDILPVEATWFVDPPYIGAGKSYRHGSEGLDYEHLGRWCESLRGRVIVCENAGADWLPFEPFASIKATSGHGRTGVSHEVIWLGEEITRIREVIG